MIINASNQEEIKIAADSYEKIFAEKSRSKLNQVINRNSKARQITIDLQNPSSNESHNSLLLRIIQDQLQNFKRFDRSIKINIGNLLSFHFNGSLVSQSTHNISRNSLQRTEVFELENYIINLDYTLYNAFNINVSFKILNEISPAQDKKQVLENIIYCLSNTIDFSLENVLSIENILLTQVNVKIHNQYKIECSQNKVKFHSYFKDEGSFTYCIIRLMKIFNATEIDLYIDDDCAYELLEHLFHKDNREKANQINQMKIHAFSKLNQKQFLSIQFDGEQLKIDYSSDKLQIPGYNLENLFTSFIKSEIKVSFKDIKTINFIKEIKRLCKYANYCKHPQLEIVSQKQEFYIRKQSKLNSYTYNLSFTADNFSIKQVTLNSFIISQYPEYDSNIIGQSINKYFAKIFNTIGVRVYRYFYFIEVPTKLYQKAIKMQEEQEIKKMMKSKCFNNVLDIRINNNILNFQTQNLTNHSLLAFLRQLKIQNKQHILRKGIILEMFMLFLKQS